MTIITTIALSVASILWVEIIRDCHHALAHVWAPLGRLHNWHHRVFRPDLSPVSADIYRRAHWYNDVPESLVMLVFSVVPWWVALHYQLPQAPFTLSGTLYTLSFLFGAIARGLGLPYAEELTDITHRQGPFTELPKRWFVNRTYHWRHHFDDQNAYFCGTVTLIDQLLGTALSLKGKRIAITGASGTLGRALIAELQAQGAKVTALTSKPDAIAIQVHGKTQEINTLTWQVGEEAALAEALKKIDILILNHGVNVHGDRSPEAIETSYGVNTFSSWRLMELFFRTVQSNREKATKEVWVNTSEAEVNPAFSPLYELSKRSLGDLVTLARLDAPCIVRKLILGPFKSELNPSGIMAGTWVAKQICRLARRDVRNIIVTINPLTYLLFLPKEWSKNLYFRCFSRKTPLLPTRKNSL